MARTQFEELRVYQLAEELADKVWEIVLGWKPFEKGTIGKQLVQAADSIGANIAEGTGRGNYNDNKRFAKIARASLFEAKHWLRRAFKRKLLTNSQTEAMQALVEELGPKLGAYINSIGPRK